MAFDRGCARRGYQLSDQVIPLFPEFKHSSYIMRDVAAMERGMLVVTTENVPGHQVVEVKGQCHGIRQLRELIAGVPRAIVA